MIKLILFGLLAIVGYAGLISDNPAAALLIGKGLEQKTDAQATGGEAQNSEEAKETAEMVGKAALIGTLDSKFQNLFFVNWLMNKMNQGQQQQPNMRGAPQGFNDYGQAMMMNQMMMNNESPMMNPYLMSELAENMGDAAENMMMMNMMGMGGPMGMMGQQQPFMGGQPPFNMMNMGGQQPGVATRSSLNNKYANVNDMMNMMMNNNMMNMMMNMMNSFSAPEAASTTMESMMNNPYAWSTYGGMDKDTAQMLFMMQAMQQAQGQGADAAAPSEGGLSPEQLFYLSQTAGDNPAAAGFFMAQQPGMDASMLADPYLFSKMDSSDLMAYQMLEAMNAGKNTPQKKHKL